MTTFVQLGRLPQGGAAHELNAWRREVVQVLEGRVQGRVETTSATTTVLAAIRVPLSTAVAGTIHVLGRQKAGTGTIGHTMGFAAWVDTDGTTVNSTTIYSVSDNAWTVTFGMASGNLEIRVTGEANKTIAWQVDGELVETSL